MVSPARGALMFVFLLALASVVCAEKPNFVIVMADDLGYGDTGPYGGWVDTPNLDRMAAEGLKFTDFHASGNVCSPTRAGLLTGRYQQRAGIPGVVNADPAKAEHHSGLQASEVTFADRLRKAGYATALMGKWHLGYTKNFNPVHHGFNEFRGYVSGNVDYISHLDRMGVYDWWSGLDLIEEEGYTTHLITRHALRFIEENKDRPFCLYVAHEAVHSPFQGPNDPPQRVPSSGKKSKKGEERDTKEIYRTMLEEMDTGVGQILDTVNRLELAEKTLVIFFSDNGAMSVGSNAPLRGFKGSNWEGGHREPAIAWWPGRIEPGTVTDQLAVSLDLMPTMLELGGGSLPEGHKLDGVSLAPVLLEGKSLGRRKLFWNDVAMRDGPWKLMLKGKGLEGIGLYNLDDDVGEQNNLADKYPDRVESMRAQIEAWTLDVNTGATEQPGLPDSGS